jgi:hypothetical protein
MVLAFVLHSVETQSWQAWSNATMETLSTVTGAAQHAKLKVDGAAQTLSVRGAAAPRSAAETGWSILAK